MRSVFVGAPSVSSSVTAASSTASKGLANKALNPAQPSHAFAVALDRSSSKRTQQTELTEITEYFNGTLTVMYTGTHTLRKKWQRGKRKSKTCWLRAEKMAPPQCKVVKQKDGKPPPSTAVPAVVSGNTRTVVVSDDVRAVGRRGIREKLLSYVIPLRSLPGRPKSTDHLEPVLSAHPARQVVLEKANWPASSKKTSKGASKFGSGDFNGSPSPEYAPPEKSLLAGDTRDGGDVCY